AGVSSIAQISFIPVVSAHCEQFIKYDCKGSLLFRPDDPATGWWVSHNGIQLLYSGGASPVDFKKCVCGTTSPNICVRKAHIAATVMQAWIGPGLRTVGTSLKSSFCDTTIRFHLYINRHHLRSIEA
ncbi:unnamed protein product, partial [Porites lobata]